MRPTVHHSNVGSVRQRSRSLGRRMSLSDLGSWQSKRASARGPVVSSPAYATDHCQGNIQVYFNSPPLHISSILLKTTGHLIPPGRTNNNPPIMDGRVIQVPDLKRCYPESPGAARPADQKKLKTMRGQDLASPCVPTTPTSPAYTSQDQQHSQDHRMEQVQFVDIVYDSPSTQCTEPPPLSPKSAAGGHPQTNSPSSNHPTITSSAETAA